MTDNVFVNPHGRWHPIGSRSLNGNRPEPGQVLAYDYTAWRVIRVEEWPQERWGEDDAGYLADYMHRDPRRWYPYVVILRPADLDATWENHKRDLHLKAPSGRRHYWDALPEHYPVFVHCAELMPCREVVAEETAAHAIKRLDKFESAGVCPSCQEPVTARQKSLTFTENLELPGGPALTFHLRGRCRWGAEQYETRWVAADPNRRRAQLSCDGSVTNHNDGTYDCTALNDCPGPSAHHRSLSVCRCPDCHARGSFGCDPGPNAVRNGSQRPVEEQR